MIQSKKSASALEYERTHESDIAKFSRILDDVIFQYLTNIAVSALTTLAVLKMIN